MNKLTATLTLMFLVSSCGNVKDRQTQEDGIFTQGEICIHLPVHQATDEQGRVVMKVLNDGGSRIFDVIDATSKEFSIFVDHSIVPNGEFSMTGFRPNVAYINGNAATGIKVLDQEKFREAILDKLK